MKVINCKPIDLFRTKVDRHSEEKEKVTHNLVDEYEDVLAKNKLHIAKVKHKREYMK